MTWVCFVESKSGYLETIFTLFTPQNSEHLYNNVCGVTSTITKLKLTKKVVYSFEKTKVYHHKTCLLYN